MPPRKRKKSASTKQTTSSPLVAPITTTIGGNDIEDENRNDLTTRQPLTALTRDDIIVGNKYMVIGGEWSKQQSDDESATYLAEILAIKEKLSTSTKDSGKDFYVHFDGLDKRLDEWVSIKRIVCEDSSNLDSASFHSPNNQRSSSRPNSHNKRLRLRFSTSLTTTATSGKSLCSLLSSSSITTFSSKDEALRL